ncbi:MAG TPA: pyrroloquinoline quinone biosynthesis protein PqqB [Myxococcota bacterium]|nr:pyrroloquinoline quinone biosynthesis protein PqqB [Myxococcota bacterium]
MQLRVLGSAAGGGFPQWNCGCANCAGLRAGSLRARARTQESVAVSADGERWLLLNASPEIRAQLESFAPLWPRAKRHSPVSGIVLTNGDLDHTLGLLSLRESHPISVWATAAVRSGFTSGNTLYPTLERFEGQVTWHALELGRELALGDTGLFVTALPVPGKLPLHLERTRAASPEDNVGLRIRDPATGGVLAYLPAVAGASRAVSDAAQAADCVFFDGTFWSSDELVAAGLGTRRAEDMAHWPVGGSEGSLAWLAKLPGRRILIHVNNTNPLLREDGRERAAAEAAGVEVAHDGLELYL